VNRLCKLLEDEVVEPREFAVIGKCWFDEIGLAAAQRPCRMPRQQSLDFVALQLFIDHVYHILVRSLAFEQLLLVLAHRTVGEAPGWEAQHVAPIDPNHDVEPRRVRLHHAPEPGFGQFNRSTIIMDDEIQVRI
jgi:hypothetical protein